MQPWTELHIFDPDVPSSGFPDDSAGVITIKGSSAQRLILIWIASESTTSDDVFFLSLPAFPQQPGLRNLAGIEFVDQDGLQVDTSLRDNALLSATVAGNITGPITAGAIYRVDAQENSLGLSLSGSILGSIRSTAADRSVYEIGLSGEGPSIGAVRAATQIGPDATIIADGVDTFVANNNRTWGSVGSVRVGPSESAIGILGDVVAERGTIGEVTSTGKIGTDATLRTQIRAGLRVGRVAINSELDGEPLNVPIFADITGSTSGLASSFESLGSSLSVLETGGDFEGSIHLVDVNGSDDQLGPTHSSGRKGIFVGGDFLGDITVTYSWRYADMIARSFRGNISVGQVLKGAVVAVGTEGDTDPLDGTIHSIEVGFGGDPSNPNGPFAGSPRPEGIPGFSGNFRRPAPPPFEGSNRDNWYTLPEGSDPYTVDSVIRATNSIETVRLASMSNQIAPFFRGLGKFGRPRIESPLIQSLEIGFLDAGAVWSGKLNSSTSTVTNDIADDYASVVELVTGCVGPLADLWVKDCSLIDLGGDVFGEIHTPSLDSGQTVRIHGKLGSLAQADATTGFCGRDPRFDEIAGYNTTVFEDSPRHNWYAIENNQTQTLEGIASYGRILIREPDGLRGQIIIDANNTGPQRAGTHWLGDVEIGTGESPDTGDPNISVTPEVISTDDIRATAIGSGSGEGPLYTALPSSFGGGAVGLVPFALHDQASTPDNPAVGDEVPGVILESIFLGSFPDPSRPDRIRLEFYGPILSVGTDDPVSIRYPDGLGGTVDANALDWFDFRIVNAPGTNSPRVLEIFAGSGASNPMPLSVFTVTPNPNLLCDLGPGIAPVAVAPFTYRFKLLADCPSVDGAPNGIPDAEEIEASRDPVTGISPLDDGFDGEGNPLGIADNGIIDECDRTCSPCAADYDDDGGVTGGDLAAFFFDFEQGLTCADVDGDGGVTGGDLAFFFAAFEAGGCE